LSDGIKRFPPEYNKNKVYPRQYNLDTIDVFVEAEPGKYFSVSGLPESIGFGKHAFTLNAIDPIGEEPLKNHSTILIEAKDIAGNLIYSGITDSIDINGSALAFIWVKEDPLLIKKDIRPGVGTLTIVGQIDNVPGQYQNHYNVRTTIPINIRPDFSNTSPILIQSSSLIKDNLVITETLQADLDNVNFNRSYANIKLEHLKTYGGEIDKVQISYLESGSLSQMGDNDFTFLTTHQVIKESGSFEDDIDFRISNGLNPLSQSFAILMPPMANQSGSQFGLDDNKFKFKFEFLNKNNQKATEPTGNELEITSSYIDFAGPATVIGGEGNLIDGQMFLGSVVNQGMEMNAENSAFIRSIGYHGFTSASAGSGSGFMMYSGSVLGANTDDYAQGGVGFEFVSSSEAFFRFNTNPSTFDVRAKTFFVGSENTQFISGSGQNIEISSSKFHLKADGTVTMSGQLAVEAGGEIGGFTISETALSTEAFILSSSQNPGDPASFISSSNFKVSAGGQVTASNIFIEGAIITGSTNIDVFNDIRVKGQKVASINVNNNINLGDENATISASRLLVGEQAKFNNITGSAMSMSGHISASSISTHGGATFGDDVFIDGNLTATTFTTQQITTNLSEGSTIFGDTLDDSHQFTGSMSITGSQPLEFDGVDGNTTFTITPAGNLTIDAPSDISASANFQSERTFVHELTSSGKVSIGGTRAGDKELEVQGDISASGALQGSDLILSNTGGVSAEIQSTTGDSFIRFTDGGSHKFSIGFDNGDSTFAISTGSGLSNNQSVTIDSVGRVGIGTSKPTEILSVDGNIHASGSISSSGDFYTSGSYFSRDSQHRFEGAISASGDIVLKGTISSSGTDTNYFGGALETEGDITINSPASKLIFRGDDTSENHEIESDANLFITIDDDNDDSNNFVQFRGVGPGGVVNLMRIEDGGDVGIGTTSPDSALQLYRASGNTQLKITSNTDNAYLFIDSGQDGSGGEESGIIFADNGSAKWEVFKTSGNDYSIHDYTRGASSFLIADGGDMKLMHNGGDVQLGGSLVSPSFTSGFAGSGFKIDSGSDGKHSLTIDDLTVRGQMNVFEMLIHQIRATNGSLFVSNTGRIISASVATAGDTKEVNLFFDTGSGYGHSFRPGDVIRAQRFTPSANGSGSTDGDVSYKSDLTIVSVTSTSESVARLTGSLGSVEEPQQGYEYVRIGSMTDSDRQGSIYLTADDDHAPFIDVADGVKTHAGFNTTGNVKTRIGKLSGVTSEKFGSLTGYGFYASGSAFLEGTINATAGTVGGWALGATIISSSTITLDTTNHTITLGSTTFGDSGVQLSGSGEFYAGDGSDEFIKYENSKALIKAANFQLDSSGGITASDAILSGKVTATTGKIGGFEIGSNAITSSNFTLSSSAETNGLFISHSSFKVRNSGQITASALFLTGSSGENFLQFDDGTLTVRGDVAASTLSTTNFSVNAAGQITASAGTIGGFTITGDKIHSGSKIELKADSPMFSINNATFGETGVQLQYNGGNPRVHIGKKGSSGIKLEGNDFQLTSSKIDISGSSGDVKIQAASFLLGDATSNISGSSNGVQITTPSYFIGSGSSFISGSNGNIRIASEQFSIAQDGTAEFTGDVIATHINTDSGSIGGFTITGERIESDKFILSSSTTPTDFIISASNFNVKAGGQLTASAVKITGDITATSGDFLGAVNAAHIKATSGSIGGFTIGAEELSINNIKLSAKEGNQGLLISSSAGVGKVRITSGSLSTTEGSTQNHFSNASFELQDVNTAISASTHTTLNGWYFKNSSTSNTIELANSASVSMSFASTPGDDGAISLKINVHRELGPAGTGEDQNPQ